MRNQSDYSLLMPLVWTRRPEPTGRLRVAELFFDVPLDYNQPKEGTIRLFARGVKRRTSSAETEKEEKQLPWFVYLQGGPGSPCYSPQEYGWVGLLIDKGYQVCSFRFPFSLFCWQPLADILVLCILCSAL